MASLFTSLLDVQGYLVIDGGLATELEQQGADIKDELWSAKLLMTDPHLVKKVHRAYYDAGADVATTASYQASFEGFAKKGWDRRKAIELMTASVVLAKEARDDFWALQSAGGSDEPLSASAGLRRQRPLVAASVGCYGAALANGAEYSGDYGDMQSVTTLMDWHRPRMQVLWEAGPDLLACETIPRADEAIALTHLLQELPAGAQAWIAFVCKDGRHLTSGELVADAVAAVCREDSGRRVAAVGFNCTAPEHILEALKEASAAMAAAVAADEAGASSGGNNGGGGGFGGGSAGAAAAGRFMVVYPNSGEQWNPAAKEWIAGTGVANGSASSGGQPSFEELTRGWRAAGAAGVGGCCRTRPSTIAAVRRALEGSAAAAAAAQK